MPWLLPFGSLLVGFLAMITLYGSITATGSSLRSMSHARALTISEIDRSALRGVTLLCSRVSNIDAKWSPGMKVISPQYLS